MLAFLPTAFSTFILRFFFLVALKTTLHNFALNGGILFSLFAKTKSPLSTFPITGGKTNTCMEAMVNLACWHFKLQNFFQWTIAKFVLYYYYLKIQQNTTNQAKKQSGFWGQAAPFTQYYLLSRKLSEFLGTLWKVKHTLSFRSQYKYYFMIEVLSSHLILFLFGKPRQKRTTWTSLEGTETGNPTQMFNRGYKQKAQQSAKETGRGG